MPGHGLGHLDPEVVLHEGEGQIDPGGDPGARPELPVPDVDRIGVDLDGGELGGQLLGAGPVGGDPSTVEQPGLRRPGRRPVHTVATRRQRGAVAAIHDISVVVAGAPTGRRRHRR